MRITVNNAKIVFDNAILKNRFYGYIMLCIKSEILRLSLNKTSSKLLSTEIIDWKVKPASLSYYYVINFILNHLILKSNEKYTYISIDDRIKLPNTKTQIERIARFINYGNDEFKGDYTFSKVFKKYQDNIEEYYNNFMLLYNL